MEMVDAPYIVRPSDPSFGDKFVVFAVASRADGVVAVFLAVLFDWFPCVAVSLAELGVDRGVVLVFERAVLELREALLNRGHSLRTQLGLEVLVEVDASLLVEMRASVVIFLK